MERAESLVADAVRRWGSGHRAPGARDRHRLAERVAAELDGGDETVIRDELTRDLGDARSAVSVVLGARTATPGWGQSADPRPDATRYEITGPRPVWCGVCDERTRLVAYERADGSEGMRRCRRCHPDEDTALPASADSGDDHDQAAPDEVDETVLERMRASLNSEAGNDNETAPVGASVTRRGDGKAWGAYARELMGQSQQ